MEKIISFKYNNCEYILFYDKELICGKNINGKLSFDLTQDEKDLVFSVYSKVVPTDNLKKLRNVTIHKKVFQHFFDLTNRLHVFYDEFNNIPKLEDFIILNKLYNNQKQYFESIKKDKKALKEETDANYIRRNVSVYKRNKKEKICVNIFLSLTLIYAGFVHLQYVPNITNAVANVIQIETGLYKQYESLNENDIIKTINNNPNLSNDEKKYLTSFNDFFTDMLPYWDYSDLMDSLSKMTINYTPESASSSKADGTWDPIFRQISIYESTKLTKDNIGTLRHEFFHATTSKAASLGITIDDGFYELLNRVMDDEYSYQDSTCVEYDHGYDFIEEVGYILLDLFDSETLKAYHAKPNLQMLIDNLMNIIPDEDMAYNLLNDFNDYFLACKGYYDIDKKLFDYKSKDEFFADMSILSPLLKENLKKYWELKHNKSISSDPFIYFLYNKTEYYIDRIENMNNDSYISYSEFADGVIANYKSCINQRLFNSYDFKLLIPLKGGRSVSYIETYDKSITK